MGLIPPIRVSSVETSFDRTTALFKETASFNVEAGDVLVFSAQSEDFAGCGTLTPTTTTGGPLSWSPNRVIRINGFNGAELWTALVDVAQSLVVRVTRSVPGNSLGIGCRVSVWRAHGGIGATNNENGTDGGAGTEPSLSLICQAESAIAVSSGDWNAQDGASRTWRTGDAGAITGETYFRDALAYAVYIAAHLDVGAAGAKAVGLSAPVSQAYSIVAAEIMGIETTKFTVTKPDWINFPKPKLRRAA